MATDQSALLGPLAPLKLTDVTDRIQSATETLYQELIDAEATAFIGAAPFDRSESRTAQRNGSGSRTLTTTAGDLHLSIPKLRQGSCLLPYSRLSDDSPAFGSATAYAPRRRARSATQASDGLSMEWKPSPARDDAFQALRVQNGH